MKWVLKALKYLFSVVLVGGLAAYLWFWALPVGLNNYVNKVSIQMVLDSPEMITSLGLVDNTVLDFHSDKLDSYTAESEDQALAFLREAREGLDDYGPEGLEGQELLSWKITAWFFDNILRSAEHKYSGYRVNQISGVMVNMPQFLTDQHRIANEQAAVNYLARLKEFGRVIDEVKVRVLDDRDNGVVAPDFILDKALVGMRSFSDNPVANNPLVTSLQSSLDKLDDIDAERKAELVADATALVAEEIIPGYQDMISLFEELQLSANHDAGIWRLPNGQQIYIDALQSNTTTTLSAEQIHQTGLDEVARIESEMEAILVAQGYSKGSFVERVQYLMQMPEHNFANTDEGRIEQIAYLNQVNDQLMANIGDYFITIPPQPLEILRVPEYAQDSSPGGYYMSPALDGSLPGRFYINQKNTTDNPRWTLPTLILSLIHI